ncbi:MAG: prohibitin family protein [Lachnospiraceae bacterium]|nr:prohibitin family protein [Candidatus Merdinaster equi]
MALFIGGIIVTIVAFIALGFSGKVWRMNIKQAGALVGVAICVFSCFKTVPTGHTGIVTTFGKVEDYTFEAGVHVTAPWHTVVNMDNRTQKDTLSLFCFSSDIQEVSVVYTVNYQIDKANAQNIYKNIGTDYLQKVVEPKIQEAVKGVFAKYNAENLIAMRANLSSEVEAILAASLKAYNIELTSTSLENIDFTDSFTEAVEAKQVAEQNKLKSQTESEQAIIEANADAQKVKIAAQAQADAQIIAAQADAEVAKIGADAAEYQGQKDAAIMSNLGAQITNYPDLIKYYLITGWNGTLPETMLSDSMEMFFGIDGIGKGN